MKLILIIAFSIAWKYSFPQTDKYTSARKDMVKYQISDRGIGNSEVLRAMRKVPRHLFVSKEYQNDAYGDYPLPIGHGQTISQPYIVAYMTEVVKPEKRKKVLEVGTGSGYQAAVLGEIVDTVFTIEIVPELAVESASRLKNMGYNNIICRSGITKFSKTQSELPVRIISSFASSSSSFWAIANSLPLKPHERNEPDY